MSALAAFGPSLVRLQRAFLCADCEIISETKNGRCEACGSQALLGLANVLGGSVGLDQCFNVSNPVSPENVVCRLPQTRSAWGREFASSFTTTAS